MLAAPDPEPLDLPPPPLLAMDRPEAPSVYAPGGGDMHIEPIGLARPKRPANSRGRVLLFGPLLVLGIVFFIGGIAWQVTQKDIIGLGAALLGVLMASVSIYYLLSQIDEPPKL